MARRRLLPAADLPLVGGSLCLDLTNTTGARASGAPRERLLTYDDLLTWSRRAGLLDRAAAARLSALARRRRTAARRALGRVVALREALYVVFRALAEHRPPPAGATARLQAWSSAERRRRELVLERGAFRLRLRPSDGELDGMVWPVVASAIELLLSGTLDRVRRCGECDWLFLDTTKNGTRTWCKKTCADRVRARRYYARSRSR